MTCEAILDVAIRQFGERGYEGASTRAIAAEAGTVMSSITYHFGSKERLYLACADHIARQITERMRPTIDAIGAVGGLPPKTMPREKAIEGVHGIMHRSIDLMISPESRDWSKFLIREQQNPGPAFDRLYHGAMEQLATLLIGLICQARPDLDERQARATAISLFGQALVLRAARATVQRVLQIDQLSETDRSLLLATVHSNIDCILRSAPQS